MHTSSIKPERSLYWALLRNASSEEKLHLIGKLSESLASLFDRPKVTDKEATSKFIAEFCGAWKGEQTPEEIIEAIKSGESDRDPISFE